jgi:GNAT superfamily N-acetyltransferase
LQQDAPSGPADDFKDNEFPAPDHIADKTLVVHCLMTGCPLLKENPYQRQGIGARLVKALIDWAKSHGWKHIEAMSFEDLPIIYENTGCAGHVFWEKLGFAMVSRQPHPELQAHGDFVAALAEQAISAGISADRARDQITMRLDL